MIASVDELYNVAVAEKARKGLELIDRTAPMNLSKERTRSILEFTVAMKLSYYICDANFHCFRNLHNMAAEKGVVESTTFFRVISPRI